MVKIGVVGGGRIATHRHIPIFKKIKDCEVLRAPIWFPEELDWIVGCSYEGLPKRRTYVRNPIGCNMSF